MARLNTRTSATPVVRSSTVDSLYRDPTPASRANANGGGTARQSSYSVMSAGQSTNSDKENDIPPSRESTPQPRHKAISMAGKRAQRPPTPDSGSTSSGNTTKRRRTDNYAFAGSDMGDTQVYEDDAEDGAHDENEELEQNQAPPTPAEDDQDEALKYYNPDQDPEERRALLVGMKALSRGIDDNRDELIASNGDQIITTVKQLNQNMSKVRQTADAAVDANDLLKMASIAGKRQNQCNQARPGVGIDLDEFVSKCMFFMREGHAPSAEEAAPTQPRPRRQTQHTDENDEDVSDEGLDWAFLGRNVCFASNRRPPVTSFLLGPLSLQRRVRTVQARRAKAQRQPLGPATRPQELREEDIKQSENTNLTHLVKGIKEHLTEHINNGSKEIETELRALEGDPDDEDVFAACSRHRVYLTADEEPAVSLFDFAVNPSSFGQTVENLFYISFLIREGNAQVVADKHGLPLLAPAVSRNLEEHRQYNIEKHQAIFSIDFPTWRDLIEAYDITEPLIPHRVAEEANIAPGGWYG
ncbi:Nse4-domain-containing protein [Byssothecium circinans]|uniref:Non-structural maintenance of chromosomes element 4 n=1 Tax=Byssothecium circinans TaxID=147558 RepID=A0A6A5U9Y0_9PLEO|nr:Nse4-domain-containing protein [Byssothecium circinans]